MKQRRDVEAIRLQERFDDSDQLRRQVFGRAGKPVAQLGEGLPCGLEHEALKAEPIWQLLEIDRGDLAHVRRTAERRGEFGADRCAGGIEHEGLYLAPVDGELRFYDRFHPQHVGPAKFQMRPVGHHFDLRGRLRRWRRLTAFTGFRDRERHAEDVDVFGQEQAVLVGVVGYAAQPSPDDLLAEQLGCEGPEPHDVRHILGVPALRQHCHRYDVLQVLTGGTPLADIVHDLAQQFFFLEGKELLTAGFGKVCRVDDLLQARLVILVG